MNRALAAECKKLVPWGCVFRLLIEPIAFTTGLKVCDTQRPESGTSADRAPRQSIGLPPRAEFRERILPSRAAYVQHGGREPLHPQDGRGERSHSAIRRRGRE